MRRFLTASAAILLSFATLAGCSKSKAVVVYCALDREYAEPILKQFQADTGVEVKAQFDVEMTKTVGLVKAIEEEQNRPRCDVFWNNEILHTLRLQKLGLLAPYASPSASDIPAELKDKDAREKQLVRRVGDRTFVVIGENLVEQGLPADWAKTAVVVESFSDAYFALLKANPKLREVLALGERIVFRDGERVVHVKPAAAPAPAPKVEEAKPQAPAGK